MDFLIGAIDIYTKRYVLPILAKKSSSYICPSCNKEVIPKQGTKNRHHFAHKAQNNCNYFERPSESDLHYNAKLKVAEILRSGKSITFVCSCETHKLPPETIQLIENESVVTEFRSKDGSYIADIAILHNDIPRVIIEIKHTHTTTTKRPEPWYEVHASEINEFASMEGVGFICLRKRDYRTCKYCHTKDKLIGGLDKETGSYYLPSQDTNDCELICIECKSPIIKSGCIFEHKEQTTCKMYTFPTDEQLTKDCLYKLVCKLRDKEITAVTWGCLRSYWSMDQCELGVQSTLELESAIPYMIIKKQTVLVKDAEGKVKYKFRIVDDATDEQMKDSQIFYTSVYDIWRLYDGEKTIEIFRKSSICSICEKIEKNKERCFKLAKLDKNGHDIGQAVFENEMPELPPCLQCKKTEYLPLWFLGFRQICLTCVAYLKDKTIQEYKPKPLFVSD